MEAGEVKEETWWCPVCSTSNEYGAAKCDTCDTQHSPDQVPGVADSVEPSSTASTFSVKIESGDVSSSSATDDEKPSASRTATHSAADHIPEQIALFRRIPYSPDMLPSSSASDDETSDQSAPDSPHTVVADQLPEQDPGEASQEMTSPLKAKKGGSPIRHVCTICNGAFTDASYLKAHLKLHGTLKGGQFACSKCPAKFKKPHELNIHQRTHTGERPYPCTYCNARFAQAATMRTHLRTHTGERPYACRWCSATFAESATLWVHERTHTGEKPYACRFCSKTFAKACNRKTHERIHTGEKPYACNECNARFTALDTLKKHKLRHTRRGFNCSDCGAHFDFAVRLEQHMKTHGDRAPYACSHCGARYVRPSYLKKHLEIHSTDGAFVCQACSARFVHSSSLVSHRAKQCLGSRQLVEEAVRESDGKVDTQACKVGSILVQD